MIRNIRKKVSKNKAKKLRRYTLKSLKKSRMYGGDLVQQSHDSPKYVYIQTKKLKELLTVENTDKFLEKLNKDDKFVDIELIKKLIN